MEYEIRYMYVTPGPAGPFKGKDVVKNKCKKGDDYYGPFGDAVITSCRLVKEGKD